MKNLPGNNTPASLKVSVHAWRKIEEVKQSIDTFNLNNVYHLTLKEIAQKHFMSKNIVSKTFRLRFNFPIHQYIIQLRIDLAKSLLAGNNPLSICQVAATPVDSICSNFSREMYRDAPLGTIQKSNY